MQVLPDEGHEAFPKASFPKYSVVFYDGLASRELLKPEKTVVVASVAVGEYSWHT